MNFLYDSANFQRLFELLQDFKNEPSFFKECKLGLDFGTLKSNLSQILQANAETPTLRNDVKALFFSKTSIKKDDLSIETALKFLNNDINKSPSLLTKSLFIKACVDYFELKDIKFFNFHSVNILWILQNDFFGVFGASLYYDKWSFSFKKNFFGKDSLKTPCKVALCVCGALRGALWLEKLNQLIKDIGFNADVFLFTWDEEYTWAGLGGVPTDWMGRFLHTKAQGLKSKAIKELSTKAEFAKHFPKTFAKLELEHAKPLSLEKIKLITNLKAFRLEKAQDFIKHYGITNPKPNVLKYYYGKNQVLKLLEAYEVKNDLKYDYIIQVRPDCSVKPNKTLQDFERLGLNDLFLDGGALGFNDALIMGRACAMKTFLCIWDIGNFNKHLSIYKAMPKGLGTHGQSFAFCSLVGLRAIGTNFSLNVRGEISLDDWVLPNFDSELEEDIKASKLDKESLQRVREFFKEFKDLFKNKDMQPQNKPSFLQCLDISELKSQSAKLQNALQATQNQCQALQEQLKITKASTNAYKNFLSYKLGFALINAYKTRWHSGLIKFFLRDVWKIYGDFKKELNEKKAGKKAVKRNF